MSILFQKIPFLLELFINGSFLLIYSLAKFNRLPKIMPLDRVDQILNLGATLVPFVILVNVAIYYLTSQNLEQFIRKYIFSFIIFIPMVLTWGDQEFCFWLAAPHLLFSILALYDDPILKTKNLLKNKSQLNQAPKLGNLLRILKFSPAQIVLFSFSGVILLGSLLLMLPIASSHNNSLGFVDALFMATSATCVTGLSTISIATELSVFGQIVILLLIQIGGLSIMTLYASMTILLGKSMGMKDRMIIQDLLDVNSLEKIFAMIVSIIKLTFIIELWGGIILTLAFISDGYEFGQAFYYGFFHSISAFCNAGFSLFENSLENYATSPIIHGTISVLVILGGLGFIVLNELRDVLFYRKPLVRLSIHSKIVLSSSILLIAGGAIFIFYSEFLNALDGYSFWEQLQISVFQSITLRTAGFNTIAFTELHSYTIYAMCLFMFIGASPGSTGGGIKTTTLAILTRSIIATVKGKHQVEVHNRTVPPATVVKVITITFISILVTSFFILVLLKFESQHPFLSIFFEVISASGTVGLSLGLTPLLSVGGKVALSLVMLIGRIGPLTLLLAIGRRQKARGKFEYPVGKILIG